MSQNKLVKAGSIVRDSSPISLIISAQKDEEFIKILKNHWSYILSKVLGPKTWVTHRKIFDLAAPLSYYLLTTFLGLQTLGEEYASLIQYSKTKDEKIVLPSRFRRLVMLAISTLYPLVRDEGISRLMRDADEWKKDSVRLVLEKLNHLHLIIFFFQGTFYHISKRLTNVRYLSFSDSQLENGIIYRILGILSLIEFVLSIKTAYIIKNYERERSIQQRTKVSSDDEIPPSDKCYLCFGRRKHTTSTICGHIFCWDCITKWTVFKKQCPTCRYPLKGGNQLIFLHNY